MGKSDGSPTASLPEEVLRLLLLQRQTIHRITRAIDNLKKLGEKNITLSRTKGRLEQLEKNILECRTQHAQLEFLTPVDAQETEDYFAGNEFEASEDAYQTAYDLFRAYMERLNGPEVPSFNMSLSDAANASFPPRVNVKLPTIQLPKFAGSYTDYRSFSDLFSSLIDQNPTLSATQRMHYLVSCLEGEPKELIKNLAISEANYRIALGTLALRYDNQRIIVLTHLTELIELKACTKASASEIKRVRDKFAEVLGALKALNRPVNQWDDILVALLLHKLDSRTRREWEIEIKDSTDVSQFDTLDHFVLGQIRALDVYDQSVSRNKKPVASIKSHVATTAKKSCDMCSAEHALAQCTKFKEQSADQRLALVKRIRGCFNCLKRGHMPKNCTSKSHCQNCTRKHNTLLHSALGSYNGGGTTAETATPATPIMTTSVHLSRLEPRSRETRLLATAWVVLRASNGRTVRIRALLDPGSEATFVTESVVQLLRLPRRNVAVPVSGLGGTVSGFIKSSVVLTVEPGSETGPSIPAEALVIKKVTAYAPTHTFDLNEWKSLRNLPLADPNPSSKDSIEMIIGVDIYGSLLLPGLRQTPGRGPTAQSTILGWVVFGPVLNTISSREPVRVHHVIRGFELDNDLKRFWEVEEPPSESHLTEDEIKCEEHFRKTHTRAPDGRYTVRLPFKNGKPPEIGRSLKQAKCCLISLERRFAKDEETRRLYADFLTEYLAMEHMERVSDLGDSEQYVYLPHHPVCRQDSETTKLRVVFNASSGTSNRTTLNSHLLAGPKLQTDLPSIITKWRMHRIVFTADIAKMFRQIWIDSRDLDYQRILWRDCKTNEITGYRLRTVTYGTASAPYLAIRVLHQLAEDEKDKYPEAAVLLRENFYVDDVLFGADCQETARRLQEQLTALLAAGGFHLRKWASNCPALLANMPRRDHELAFTDNKDDQRIKILGLIWNPASDSFQFKVNLNVASVKSKRTILATIARLYDPLGWLAPVIVTAKIIIQNLWLAKIDWDTEVPDEPPAKLRSTWLYFCEEMNCLSNIAIPRWSGAKGPSDDYELHGFADASENAYAACVYLRVTHNSLTRVTLLTAKSKVAPVKKLSVPKLELCAATLLSRLLESTQKLLKLPDVRMHAWSDSTIVLAWLRRHPSTWPTFVANRVAEILRRGPEVRWHHVGTEENPADCASRGLMPAELQHHPLWWAGPTWLIKPETDWPSFATTTPLTEELLQQAKIPARTVHLVTLPVHLDLDVTCFSWPKILRITAYVYRFVERSRGVRDTNTVMLGKEEIDRARQYWVSTVQKKTYSSEITALKAGRRVASGSALIRLNPFLDEKGLLRLGGRLRLASLTYDERHPIILPKDRITALIIEQAHARALHGGTQLTLAMLRTNYWIVGARQMVRRCIHHCVSCVSRATLASQRMGDLPIMRVKPTRPFAHTGVDCAGPFLVRTAKGRGQHAYKGYLVLFVCLVTRAIHLELVSDYTTSGFLGAYHRFTSRRGNSGDMYSDNGLNFRGADRELRLALAAVRNAPDIQNQLIVAGTTWHFIPPPRAAFWRYVGGRR